jgi:hypothetical protein
MSAVEEAVVHSPGQVAYVNCIAQFAHLYMNSRENYIMLPILCLES